ncbi:aminotransferase class III-fold pyridoxal phosphate-dependent enzyme [Leisingera daeponensis]|uniref:Aminotransferase class III-fold pyridoxal phosphate-dependent enzyme n=1 Tax=Leisingera daeponensis TaxID=405746 RepID=A0ABS7NKN2_9RHOB|nr:aminotransferase [Leisingera daeponensis]MBY6058307.1 aminotransferase class III-fold pyridoxal phosphate-dependent enzyme [Leisingera daeponensis]MBY6141758.1 aminotransferase class III-fold pyridoxal phosphate-dependent enzyme [Leisingera daeponensis]
MAPVIYPTTNFTATEQLCLDRGEGIYVYDTDGNKYIEGLAGLWCTSLGYSNTEVMDAITEQLHKLPFSHTFGGKTHKPIMELAEKLKAMVPVEDAYIFFGNSGSDANDTHYKMLRYYFNAIGKPEKRKIITRERGYHGVTVAAGSLTSLPANLAHFDAPLEALHILRSDAPHYYTGRQGNETEEQFVDRIINNLEEQILAEDPDTIAAMIVEPITGASGVIVPPEGYYEKLQALLRKHGILVWADEVICGFGRTGADFGCTTMGIKPDLMTFAKQLSSAYFPISASVIPGWMYEAMIDQTNEVGVFGHGYTYSGHPAACAAALKTLEIYERDNLFEHAAEVGTYMQAQLREIFTDHPLVGEVRGKGLIAALELVSNKTTGASFAKGAAGAAAQKACQDNGLILRAVAGNALALCPPIIITKDEVNDMLARMKTAVDAAYAELKAQGLIAG